MKKLFLFLFLYTSLQAQGWVGFKYPKHLRINTLTIGSFLSATSDSVYINAPLSVHGYNITLYSSAVGDGNQIRVYENLNSGNPQILVEQDGAGDAVIGLHLTGITQWGIALDNSDAGDPLEIRRFSTPYIALKEGNIITLNGAYNFGSDAQADDDYEVDVPQISSLFTGLTITFIANTANTDGATLEITSVGDVDTILKNHDQALVTGDIEAGQVVTVVFDGTNWQMTSQLAQ